jgi:hypothetical protein
MKRHSLVSLLILLGYIVGCGQDQRANDGPSFTDIKNSVQRLLTTHLYWSTDEKIWNRSGDMVAIAIVETLPDEQITSPATVKELLSILHEAWACPNRCIMSPSNRQPTETISLLDHLHANTTGPIQSEIDNTRTFVLEQAQAE